MSIDNYLNRFSPKKIPYSPQRFYGGSSEKDNYFFSGYFYAIIEVPTKIFQNSQKQIVETLISTCYSASGSERSIEMGEVPGFGGSKIYIPKSQSISNSITLSFKEHTEMPVHNIFEKWMGGAIQPQFGISSIDNPSQSNVKGVAIIVYVKPTVNTSGFYTQDDLETTYIYNGIIPTSKSALVADLDSIDFFKFDITFSFDGFPMIDNSIGISALNEYNVNVNRCYNQTKVIC